MNAKNRKLNIREQIERAEEIRQAYEVLIEKGLIRDAVSRIYYCALHHIRAILMTEGLEPKTREGTLRLFPLHFVMRGIFPPDAAHAFSRLMKPREEADYDPAYVFTKRDVSDLRKECESLCGSIRACLRQSGWLAT